MSRPLPCPSLCLGLNYFLIDFVPILRLGEPLSRGCTFRPKVALPEQDFWFRSRRILYRDFREDSSPFLLWNNE